MSDIDAKRAANRAAFPAVAKIVDEFRAVFGDAVVVEGGAENGREFGVVSDRWERCANCGAGIGCENLKVICGHRMVFASNRSGAKKGKR
ncbi:MAG: hypothetical protein HKM00_09550 [Gallionella sp.]|nr:hypothetical protein [Gallionella sp.]